MVLKNIKVEEEVWWELNKRKIELRLKRISDVIKKLVEESNEK